MLLRHSPKTTSRLIVLGCVLLMLVSEAALVVSTNIMLGGVEERAAGRVARNMKVAWRVLHELGSTPRIENGELYVGATSLNGNLRFVDELSDMVGGVATVFQGDVRVTTNVGGKSDERGIGTRLLDPAVREAVLRHQLPFRGVAQVLGQPYFAAYDPMFSSDGRLIGILFVGLRRDEYVGAMEHTRLIILLVSGGAVMLIGLTFLIVGSGYARKIQHRERTLNAINIKFDAALANMAHGICLWDASDHLELSNRRFCELFQLPPHGVQPGIAGVDLLRIRPPDLDQTSFADILQQQREWMARGQPAGFTQGLLGGRTIHVLLRPIADGTWVATYEDITERCAAESRIAFLARHDALTGLANRSLFRERLDGACSRPSGAAVLYLDLDHFKEVNDTLGHLVGDALLGAVAARLMKCVREGDTVARLGGDEFAIVQPGIGSRADAEQIAWRIARTVGAPYSLRGHQVSVATSIGVALGGGESAEELLRHADLALYCAKAEQRGSVRLFEPGMEAALQTRRQLEADLRAGLADERFELHYQPLVQVRSGRVAGFEALMRWRHPERGLVPPDEFIPVAEEMGLIVPMGAWALRKACADAVGWPEHIKVAVNLSPIQFKHQDLLATVREALTMSGLVPSRLEVEITETVLLRETSVNSDILHSLRDLGVRIVLDDFGMGYSSLSYLRAFPFDKIKIDRSFVAQLGLRRDCDAIVSAVTGLAHALGIQTTGEGVETADQMERLRAEGCSEAQGYLFSKPLPVAEVPATIARIDRERAARNPLNRIRRETDDAALVSRSALMPG